MKTTLVLCAALFSGTFAAFAAEQTDSKLQESVSKIDAHVKQVEGRLPQLTRKEATLNPDDLAQATDEKWNKIHTYADGKKIERLKVYPAAGSKKTEEFYYDNDRLVLVFIEPMGAGKEGHDSKAQGTKYYFDGMKMFAVMSDGKMVDSIDGKTRALGEKLQRESKAFRAAVK